VKKQKTGKLKYGSDDASMAGDDESILCYNIDEYWKGISLRNRKSRQQKRTVK